MNTSLPLTLALTVLAAPLPAQSFSPHRAVSVRAAIEDEYYSEYETSVDEQADETQIDGSWQQELEANAALGGSQTYSDAGQQSEVDSTAGWFEIDGYAAGGLYSQLNGDVRAETLFQADFQVLAAGQVDIYYEFWFGDTWDGLSSHDRPGQALAEVRIDDAQGNLVWADTVTYEDGDFDDSNVIALGPGTYRFIARAEVVDSTFFETVYGSQTVAGLYVEGWISGGSPVDLTAPAAPMGLGALAGDAIVDLTWTPNGEGDLAGYRVYRSTTPGGGYSDISGLIGSNVYSDHAVTNDTTYYYVVTAEDTSGNESGDSNEASATPQGSGGVIETLFFGGFESGGFSAEGWVTSGNPVVSTAADQGGTYGARIRKSSWIERSVSTVGYDTIELSYARRTRNLDSGEFLFVEYWNGSNWIAVETTDSTSWGFPTISLGSDANDNADFAIRFRTNANRNNERGDVDDVEVMGTTL